MTNVLIPKIQKIRGGDSSYLKKVTALYAYEKLVLLFPKELQAPCVQEILCDLKDKIPNMRIVALKVLKAIYEKVDDSQKQAIRVVSQNYSNDFDSDVRQISQMILSM